MEKNDIATEEWLDSQKQSTKKAYRSYWKYFREFTSMTGDEILASHRADKDFAWEKRVLEFKNWLVNERKLSTYTATASAMTVRGFFAYHRMPLQYRRSESAKMGKRSRKTEDYKFCLDDLRKMFEVTNLEERYLITAGKSFGLRAGDFLRLTYGDLQPYIDREPPISIGEYNTQKESVKAFPFIDTDAQPIIKLMLEKMARDGRIGPKEKMLKFKDEIQLSRVLKRIVERAGLSVGNKQVRFHCMRKFLSDHLSSHMSESKWKQIVGKTISEGAYISADSLREDYNRAMPEMTFTKRTNEDVQAIAKLEALKLFAKASGYTAMDIAKIKMRKPQNLAEEIEEIEKLLAEKNSQETDGSKACRDEAHCGSQKMVAEEDLAGFLTENWKVIASLPSGKIVIERS
jgi:integrase